MIELLQYYDTYTIVSTFKQRNERALLLGMGAWVSNELSRIISAKIEIFSVKMPSLASLLPSTIQ